MNVHMNVRMNVLWGASGTRSGLGTHPMPIPVGRLLGVHSVINVKEHLGHCGTNLGPCIEYKAKGIGTQ